METQLAHNGGQPGLAGDRLRRIATAIVLIAVAAASWAITVRRMQGMDMGPGTDLGGLGWFAAVWATMMAAMMLPSLVPMAVTYAGASEKAGARSPSVGTAVFVCGYLLMWLGAGVLAYGFIQAVASLDLSWLAWGSAGQYVAGGVILGAALYELTPVKATCLRHCRNPASLTLRWRSGLAGPLMMGIEHGAFCVGTSWALMAALFAIGVMNVTWMIVVAALIAIEKLAPWDGPAVGATALFLIVLAVLVAFAPHQVPAMTIPG
jgi:predicted metal-binding membrane protein